MSNTSDISQCPYREPHLLKNPDYSVAKEVQIFILFWREMFEIIDSWYFIFKIFVGLFYFIPEIELDISSKEFYFFDLNWIFKIKNCWKSNITSKLECSIIYFWTTINYYWCMVVRHKYTWLSLIDFYCELVALAISFDSVQTFQVEVMYRLLNLK